MDNQTTQNPEENLDLDATSKGTEAQAEAMESSEAEEAKGGSDGGKKPKKK